MVSPRKLNVFTLFKLPSVWLCGVRVKSITAKKCEVAIKHRWINQNPFKSMFWAVQGMAAELSTGAMLAAQIEQSSHKISMLVASNKANFSKKARGKIVFTCTDGALIKTTLEKAIKTKEGETLWMQSIGVDEEGDVVSTFNFEWTIKLKK